MLLEHGMRAVILAGMGTFLSASIMMPIFLSGTNRTCGRSAPSTVALTLAGPATASIDVGSRPEEKDGQGKWPDRPSENSHRTFSLAEMALLTRTLSSLLYEGDYIEFVEFSPEEVQAMIEQSVRLVETLEGLLRNGA
jgi:hypothetical protein